MATMLKQLLILITLLTYNYVNAQTVHDVYDLTDMTSEQQCLDYLDMNNIDTDGDIDQCLDQAY